MRDITFFLYRIPLWFALSYCEQFNALVEAGLFDHTSSYRFCNDLIFLFDWLLIKLCHKWQKNNVYFFVIFGINDFMYNIIIKYIHHRVFFSSSIIKYSSHRIVWSGTTHNLHQRAPTTTDARGLRKKRRPEPKINPETETTDRLTRKAKDWRRQHCKTL